MSGPGAISSGAGPAGIRATSVRQAREGSRAEEARESAAQESRENQAANAPAVPQVKPQVPPSLAGSGAVVDLHA